MIVHGTYLCGSQKQGLERCQDGCIGSKKRSRGLARGKNCCGESEFHFVIVELLFKHSGRDILQAVGKLDIQIRLEILV